MIGVKNPSHVSRRKLCRYLGLLWMIKSSHDDQRRRRERDEKLNQSDENDYDGGGNWGRFENE